MTNFQVVMMNEDNTIPSVSEYHWDLSVKYHTSGYELSYHCVENDSSHVWKWSKKWYDMHIYIPWYIIMGVCLSRQLNLNETSECKDFPMDLGYSFWL